MSTFSSPPDPEDIGAWRVLAVGAAPLAPRSLTISIAAILSDSRANSDVLLVLADALEEASVEASLDGLDTQARELHRLAELPRRIAPSRGQTVGQTNSPNRANLEMQHG